MQAVDVEFYKANRAKLLKSCPGQWVGIHAGVLIGVWESCGKAYDTTVRLTDSEDIFIHQVVPEDQEPVWDRPHIHRRPTQVH